MNKYEFSITPPKFESEDDFEKAKVFSPANVLYLQHVQADLMNELLRVSHTTDLVERDQLTQRVIGGLNLIADLINTSNFSNQG